MKRILFLLSILILLSIACSLTSLISTETESEPVEQAAPQSEKRCGDGICDGPENHENCPQDCPVEEAPGAQSLIPPPWFAPDESCQMRDTSVHSEGSPWAFDKQGNTTELLEDGQVTCVLSIQICGDTIFKQQVVNAGEDCPESYHYSFASPREVCCEKWDQAKQSGSPCDPMSDADCDGVLNDNDAYPLEFAKQ